MNWMLLGGSLVAIIAMTWTARLLGLGAEPHIADPDQARRLADEAHCGFQAIDVAISKDGTAALLRDRTDRLMALLPHGNHFVSRVLRSPMSFRLDRQNLTLSFDEYMLGEVTLDLGGEAATWANKIENIGRIRRA